MFSDNFGSSRIVASLVDRKIFLCLSNYITVSRSEHAISFGYDLIRNRAVNKNNIDKFQL